MNEQKTISTLEAGIAKEMERLAYAPETIRIWKLNCRKFRDFALSAQGSEVFSEEIGAQYLKERYQYPFPELRPLSSTEQSAVRCIRWLGEYNAYGGFTSIAVQNRDPVEIWGLNDAAQITAFIEGIQTPDNSDATKEYRYLILHGFYHFIASHKLGGVKDLNAEVLSLYVLSLQGYAAQTIRHRLSVLRRYLAYVSNDGYVQTDWSYSIPIPKKPQNQAVPALWTDDEIILMLKTIDRASPIGKRDYAILLLVVQLGLRITDVSELRFSAIDWSSKTISFVQHKTSGANNNLPISDDLGWAIIDYIRYARAVSDLPYVFLSGNAPYRQMAPHSVGDIIRRAMSKAGIKKRKLVTSGMHSLRHALARRLLNEGVSLEEIANIMGHANYSSTSPYLKVDIEGLRSCCLTIGGSRDEQ